jgi:hypothetical protein
MDFGGRDAGIAQRRNEHRPNDEEDAVDDGSRVEIQQQLPEVEYLVGGFSQLPWIEIGGCTCGCAHFSALPK